MVLLDFGMVSALASGAGAHAGGTPLYMAPEQASGHGTEASDWYSLGVMLYEALTGRLPLLEAHDGDALRGPSRLVRPIELAPTTPPELDQLCLDLLHPDPMRRPRGAEILERLGVRAADPAQGGTAYRPMPPLVGRGAQLGELADALARVTAGTSVMVLVSGRSGMGKSALVAHFLAELSRSDDIVVLHGRCHQGETLPYKALDGVVDTLTDYLLSLESDELAALLPDELASLVAAFPVLARVDAISRARLRSGPATTRDNELGALGALRTLLARIAQRKRVILHIDDLQWGDLDSAPLIAWLLNRTGPPILSVLSYRDEAHEADDPQEVDEASQPLRPLVRWLEDRADGTAVVRVRVEPLDAVDAAALARRQLRDKGLPEHHLARVLEESRGSPYFVCELVGYLDAGFSSAARGLRPDATVTLEHAILARVDGLPGEARRMLEVVAISGEAPVRAVVRRASGVNERYEETLATLRARRLLRCLGSTTEPRLDVFHDRVRKVVLGQLSEDASLRLHRQVAQSLESLESLGLSWPQHRYALAHHLFHARDPLRSARAFEVNREAAQTAAAAFAYERAHAFFTQARELAERASIPFDAALEQHAGEVASRTGRLVEAIGAFQRALVRSNDPLLRATARFELSRARLAQLDIVAASAEASAALAELGTPPPRSRGWGAVRAVGALVRGLRVLRAPRRFGSAAASAELLARTQTTARIYTHQAVCAYFAMDRSAMLTAILVNLEPAARLGYSSEIVHWHASAAAVAAIAGQRWLADRLIARASALAAHVNSRSTSAWAEVYAGHAAHFSGDERGAARLLEACLIESGSWLETADYLTAVADLCWSFLMRGHTEAGWRWVRKGMEREALAGVGGVLARGHTYRCYAGPLLALRGRLDEGAAHLTEFEQYIRSDDGRNPWRRAQVLAHRALFLTLAGRLGDELEEVLASHRSMNLAPGRVPLQLQHFYVAQAYARLWQLEAGASSRGALRHALQELSRCGRHPTLRHHGAVDEAALRRLEKRPAAALACLSRALRLSDAIDSWWGRFEVLGERARLATDPEKRRRLARRALAIATERGWPLQARRLKDVLGEPLE